MRTRALPFFRTSSKLGVGVGLLIQEAGFETQEVRQILFILRYFILEEIWKSIEEYPQFEISNCGNICRIATGKVLKRAIGSTGYYQVSVSLGKKGTYKTFKIHREVAKAFIPNPSNKPHINHIDGDKLNPHVSNLEWATHADNMRHAFDNNLIVMPKGEDCHNSVLKESDILFIRKNYSPYGKNGLSGRELAKLFNVHHETIRAIIDRRKWKHL